MRTKQHRTLSPLGLSLAAMRTHPHHLKVPFAVEVQQVREAATGIHMHNGLELGLCVRGTTEHSFRSHARTIAAGQAWLVGMWEPHAWTVPPGTSLVHFYFEPEVLWNPSDPMLPWLHMFSAAPEQRPQADSPSARQQMLAIAHEVTEEAARQEEGWLRMCRLALLRALVILEREWHRSGHATAQAGASVEDLGRLAEAVELVNDNLHRRIPAEEAAAGCGLSVSRFQHVFRESFGVSYGRFGLRARLAASVSLLLQRTTSVDALAAELGFTDASHFRRAFTAEYGITPADLRRQRSLHGSGALSPTQPDDSPDAP